MHEPHFRVLRVEGAAMNPSAGGRANYDGNRSVPAVAALGGEIDDLIEAATDEIGELHLSHRAQSHESSADRSAYNGRFGDRRIDHPLFAKFFQKAGRYLERAAVDANIFADQEHVRIALHLFPKAFANGFEIGGAARRLTLHTRFRATWPGRDTGYFPPRQPPRPPRGASGREDRPVRCAKPSLP